MSSYDTYDAVDDRGGHRSHRHREKRDVREPRYVETRETYVRAPAPVVVPLAPDVPYVARQTEIIRRPAREDSDLSVEEVRRDFPPPGAAGYVQQRTVVRGDRYGPPVRSRSAERGYGGAYIGDPRRSYNDLDDRRSRKSAVYVERETQPRRRSLSRNQKIIAAVGGAALAVGGKELWDRRESQGRPVERNPLGTAAIGAAGAFAGYEGAELYAKRANIGEKVKTYVATQDRDGRVAEAYYSSTDSDAPKRHKSRRKSLVEGALGALGVGAAAKAAGGGRSRRGSGSSHGSRRSRSGRGRSPEGAAKFQRAAKAALLAGAAEAFRVRNEPGGWSGEKGKRILTAAIGAGGIDAAADRNSDHTSKRHILEAVVGGLAGNRLINGSRNTVEDDGRSIRSRNRSRSRSRGPGGGGGGAGLAALATAGLGALAGKKLLDRSRSRSRSRGSRRRRDSPDSYDSRSPSPRRDRHRRSKSVTDYARKGLAALGIGEGAAHERDHRDRDRDRDVLEVEETRVRRKSRRGDDDDYDSRGPDAAYAGSRGDPYGESRNFNYRSSVSRSAGSGPGGRGSGQQTGNGPQQGGGSQGNGATARQKDGQRNRRIAEGKESATDSDSSLGSSSGDEKRIRKMKGKQFLTAGLAGVATIHAAHNIYQSMEKREARRKAVQEGEMSPEEARKLKAKATLQDAASVGIAALGIKGAFSELKEARETRHEYKEFCEKKEDRHKKRAERQRAMKTTGGGMERRQRLNGYAPAGGPRYIDDNPYSTLPAPPVGYYDGR